MSDLPTLVDVRAAATVLLGKAVRTPLLTCDVLNDKLKAKIYFKAENLQRTGSFKFRGATNAVHNIDPGQGARGIVACSSGNHAQGVAEAARLKGYPATIIMPSDAPLAKITRTQRSGATVIQYDRANEDRDAIMASAARKSGAAQIHPYDNFYVIAGQGTAGLEACEDLVEMGVVPEHTLVCAGGGGLLAGTLLAVQEYFPNCQIHTVEPVGYDDQARSHAAGERLGDNGSEPSVCDAIVTPMPGEMSFKICAGKLGNGLSVSDDEVLQAVAFAFCEMKTVVEPGGAVALAALLSGKIDVEGKTVLATFSGGNIDESMMARALTL